MKEKKFDYYYRIPNLEKGGYTIEDARKEAKAYLLNEYAEFNNKNSLNGVALKFIENIIKPEVNQYGDYTYYVLRAMEVKEF